jgi:hypothetical protein
MLRFRREGIPDVSVSTLNTAGSVRPQVLSEVKPIDTREELEGRRESTVVFRAEIAEHVTLINIHYLSPSDASEGFILARQLARSLWRFAPARINR